LGIVGKKFKVSNYLKIFVIVEIVAHYFNV
jgi:hypothetical protein